MTHTPRRSRLRARLAPLLCLLSACALVVAQSPPPPARNATGQSQPPAPPVKLNVIVSDESAGSAVEVRREEIGVREDGVPQTITNFTKEELPVSYALVIDNSASVRSLLNYVIRTAGTIVSGNKAGDETLIVRFVDSPKIEEIQDFTNDSGDLESALASLYIEGGSTAVIDAVYLSAQRVAGRRKEDAGRRRALVLISDCDERASRFKESDLINLLRREGVQVFVIAFLMGLDDEAWSKDRSQKGRAGKLAEKLAAETGGRAFFPKKVDELIKAVAEVSRDLRSQHVVTYTPTNANADGKFRKVEVSVADAPGRAKRKAVARAGYFAPGGAPEATKKEK